MGDAIASGTQARKTIVGLVRQTSWAQRYSDRSPARHRSCARDLFDPRAMRGYWRAAVPFLARADVAGADRGVAARAIVPGLSLWNASHRSYRHHETRFARQLSSRRY